MFMQITFKPKDLLELGTWLLKRKNLAASALEIREDKVVIFSGSQAWSVSRECFIDKVGVYLSCRAFYYSDIHVSGSSVIAELNSLPAAPRRNPDSGFEKVELTDEPVGQRN
jgi:hypothetical protein